MPDPIPSELVETVSRLRELLANATPGPWQFDGCSLSDFGREYPCSMSMEWIANTFDGDEDPREKENGTLIAEAVTALPALLDLIERLTSAPAGEPFGYWVEQRHADAVLLRKPAYIPEPNQWRTVTPLYTASPSPSSETSGDDVGGGR